MFLLDSTNSDRIIVKKANAEARRKPEAPGGRRKERMEKWRTQMVRLFNQYSLHSPKSLFSPFSLLSSSGILPFPLRLRVDLFPSPCASPTVNKTQQTQNSEDCSMFLLYLTNSDRIIMKKANAEAPGGRGKENSKKSPPSLFFFISTPGVNRMRRK